MATEYYYDITYLDTKTVDDTAGLVCNINWRYVATADDGTVAHVAYNTEIDPSITETTIAFDSLEAATVVGWIEQNISEEDANRIKAMVDGIIEMKQSAPVARDLPWLQEE
jgi:hypothetical protein